MPVYDSKKKKTVQTTIAKDKLHIENDSKEESEGVNIFEAFNPGQFEIGIMTIAANQEASRSTSESNIHAFYVQNGKITLTLDTSKEFVLATGSVFYVPPNIDSYTLNNTSKRIAKLVYFTSK